MPGVQLSASGIFSETGDYWAFTFNQLLIAKKQAYAEYRQVRQDLKDYQIARKAMEVILNKDRQQEEEKEKRKER